MRYIFSKLTLVSLFTALCLWSCAKSRHIPVPITIQTATLDIEPQRQRMQSVLLKFKECNTDEEKIQYLVEAIESVIEYTHTLLAYYNIRTEENEVVFRGIGNLSKEYEEKIQGR